MKYTKLIALIFMVTLTSAFHKDLNEYGKWLKFHGLEDESFTVTGKEQAIQFQWKPANLDNDEQKLLKKLYFHSPDSSQFLDLYSYNTQLHSDSKGHVTSSIGDPDSKIQLIQTKSKLATTLLFLGTIEYIETAIWRTDKHAEFFGFTIENEKYIPTTWKFDFDKMVFQVYKSKHQFKDKPNSYFKEVILDELN
jgi:hypothetical protein